ncbi:hypothetical protein KSS87_022155 [Heliosperma pusillum]|nr:hypothetical protein KSS87_022155 [Heliosperma pusillum]
MQVSECKMESKRNQSNDTTESSNAMTELSQNSLSHNGAEQGCTRNLNGDSVCANEQGSLRSLNESVSRLNLDDQSSGSTLNLTPTKDLVSDDETQNPGSDVPAKVVIDPPRKAPASALDDGCSGTASSATVRPVSEAAGLSTQPEIPAGMDVHDQMRIRAKQPSGSDNRPCPSPIGRPKRSHPRTPSPGAPLSARPIGRPHLSPQDTLGSGPGPTLFGYITNTLQQAQVGASNVGPRYHAPGSSNSQPTRQPGRLAVPPPHILEMMAAEIDMSYQTSSEHNHSHSHSENALENFLQQAHELLDLGDGIRTVRTGLREEIIMAHLRQKNYGDCASELSESSASPEICPICKVSITVLCYISL